MASGTAIMLQIDTFTKLAHTAGINPEPEVATRAGANV